MRVSTQRWHGSSTGRRARCSIAPTTSRPPAWRDGSASAEGRDPRRRHGRNRCRVAAQRARVARRVRIDHRVPARLAARRQRCQWTRREREDRGARPAHLARVLRERVSTASRGLRRARPAEPRSRGADPHVARRPDPGDPGRPRGAIRPVLVALDGRLRAERRAARRARHVGRPDDRRRLPPAVAPPARRLRRVPHTRAGVARRALGQPSPAEPERRDRAGAHHRRGRCGRAARGVGRPDELTGGERHAGAGVGRRRARRPA